MSFVEIVTILGRKETLQARKIRQNQREICKLLQDAKPNPRL